MHILFLTDNFPPEVNAPASRTFEHCREWVRGGHEVTVITCVPNFPMGKVFEGYKNRLWQIEEMDGIRVIRVWTFITANEGFAKRILDYVSFMVSAVIAAVFVRKKVDVVLGASPQFFTACAAYLTGRIKHVPWIFELRDIWPESIRAVGAMKGTMVLDFLEKVELFLYRRASAIVSVTNAFRDNLIRRGISGSKIYVITNGVDTGRFFPRDKDAQLVERFGLSGKFVAGYIGAHGMAHALDTVLDVAKRLKNDPSGERFCFILLGDGANKGALMERARKEGLNNVIFLDTVPKEEVSRYWSILDAAIIHLKKTSLFTSVIPSKLFECMAMGIPVLHGVLGESAMIVEREGVGIVFEPENPHALYNALLRLADDREQYLQYRQNAVTASHKYDRRALAAEMLKIVESVGLEG